jgi:hypothetical protein
MRYRFAAAMFCKDFILGKALTLILGASPACSAMFNNVSSENRSICPRFKSDNRGWVMPRLWARAFCVSLLCASQFCSAISNVDFARMFAASRGVGSIASHTLLKLCIVVITAAHDDDCIICGAINQSVCIINTA